MKIGKNQQVKKYLKRLKAFHRKLGHWDFYPETETDKVVARWIENIRNHPKRLSPGIREHLISLGFPFDTRITWDHMFARLEAFYRKHGHGYVPAFEKRYEALFDWVVEQKRAKSRLSAAQIEKLNGVDLDWNLPRGSDDAWMIEYRELIQFKKQYGHAKVPQDFKVNPALGIWVSRQRLSHSKKTLSTEKIKKLQAIGFLWKEDIARLLADKWKTRYDELVRYKARHGYIDRLKIKKENYQLGLWMYTQMERKSALPADRIRKLNAIGFQWEKRDAWAEMYSRLKAFKEKFGHCRVRLRDDFKLSVWIQKNKSQRHQLTKEKKKMLEDIGIKWSHQLNDEQWEHRFRDLKEFRRTHGHLNVNKSNHSLYQWIQGQKKLKKNNALNRERLQKLEQLGFTWIGEVDRRKMGEWEKFFRKFKSLKKKFGEAYHIKLKEMPELAHWVNQQIHNKPKLSDWKKLKLNALGFLWTPGDRYRMELWKEMYKVLKAYKKRYGNCDVPQRFKDRRLAIWVNSQRTKEKKLTQVQKNKAQCYRFFMSARAGRKEI